jgi:uncharacterized protein with HEPN domain
MSENRLPDYLDHIQQAATDARSFVEGWPRTTSGRQAHPAGRHHEPDRHRRGGKGDGWLRRVHQAHADVPWRSMRNMRNRMAHGYFDINLDVVWETVQEWLPALLQQLPAVRQDADDEDRNDNCKEGSPMTAESRIFSVAEYVQPSEGEPIRSVVLETETQLSWFGMSIPGRKLRLTFILTAKTRGLFCRE